MPKNRTKNSPRPVVEEPYIKDFLDMVAPSVIDFKVDHYLCGNTCRCVWALREYPTSTDEQAILRHLGEMDGVTIRIYTRQVTPSEERRIIHNAANKHRMSRSSTEDLQQTVTAEANLQDVVTLVSSMHRNREPLLHCAVFLELTAPDYDALKLLQTDVLTELVRSKLNVDRLMLRQQEGFVSVMPAGRNAFGAQFERVLPASSVANLYPFNYSGKTDPHGFYIGKDKYGANILVDFDKRDDDKTSANILILGNSGQGKSYLLKLLLLNFLEAGKSVISLDVEHEQKDMCETVGGCFMDLMGGVYRINPLEPKCWDDGSGPEDRDAPEAFRKSTRLSQHISFLKDFFRAYKDFSDRHIDAIEIMVGKLYAKWGISDSTNFAGLKPQDYPILSDLYKLIEQEYREYDGNCHQLYTAELLQEILLGLHSMCQGAEAQFFNGHTNVTSSRFIVFGVKGLLQASKNVRGAMLFNILSYMSDRLLTMPRLPPSAPAPMEWNWFWTASIHSFWHNTMKHLPTVPGQNMPWNCFCNGGITMKKATVTVSFEQEKLKAVQFYAGKNGTSLELELDMFMEKLYKKYVPSQTREYIESMAEPEEQPRPRPARSPRSAAPDTFDEKKGVE